MRRYLMSSGMKLRDTYCGKRRFVRPFMLSFVLFSVLFQVGCGPEVPVGLEGYSHLAGSTWYRLLRLGEGDRRASSGDYVTVDLSYATDEDSVFFAGGRRFQLEAPIYAGGIEECFSSLRSGDSAQFMLDAYAFFHESLHSTLPSFIDSGERIRVDVRMVGILDSVSFLREKETFLNWAEDFSRYEAVLLEQYLMGLSLQPRQIDSIYYLPLEPGSGPLARTGDTVSIDFEGRFFDGKYFDSTLKRGEAFQFVLGQRWQVIEGLERAVRMMRSGERSLFIFPSELAFGRGGSSTGIVPPYTPVVFEVKMLELRPGPGSVSEAASADEG